MHGLIQPTRRGFGRGLGAALALAGLPQMLRAHDGTHEVEIAIARFAFDPSEIEIDANDSVIWINGDLAPHTATAEDGAWDTGALANGEGGRISFETPGRYPFFCTFHPHMKGTVVVRPKSSGLTCARVTTRREG